MNRLQKLSVARIVSDLIKADSVIDSREMSLFCNLIEQWHITHDILRDSRYLNFSDAVNNLMSLKQKERDSLMKSFKDITLADGMCNKDEALLMIALICCLEINDGSEMIYVKASYHGFNVKSAQVIYVESDFDDDINNIINNNYHEIENALRLAGFNLAYIPKIAETYKETPQELFNEVMTFLTPNLEESELSHIKEKISNMNTRDFCREQLYRKLQVNLLDTNPSFLIKVGESHCDNGVFSNYLKIEVNDNLLADVKHFIYRFTSMLNSEYSILRNIYNTKERFIYSGVYKQIIDLCLMKEDVKSCIVIDRFKQKIFFKDINEELKVSTADRALYVLILMESCIGGLNLNPCKNIAQKKGYEDRKKLIENKFSKIYRKFGGKENRVPDIFDPLIRNPKISRINSYIDKLKDRITCTEEYKIIKSDDGRYKINLEHNMVYSKSLQLTPWLQDDDWKNILNLRR